MPSQKRSRRVTKKTVAATHLSKRRSLKPRQPRTTPSAGSALLIAQFTEALGQTPRKRQRSAHRSLTEALKYTTRDEDVFGVMPGARVAASRPYQPARGDAEPVAPCIAAHRRRRLNSIVSGAASWCVAFAVTACIISAAAYGIVTHAPGMSATPISTASAMQF